MDEVKVLSSCMNLLKKLDTDARKRVVAYLKDLVETDKMPAPVEQNPAPIESDPK